MEILFASIIIVFGILQIILFFKLWGMTDDIRAIKRKYIEEQHSETVQVSNPAVQSQYLDEVEAAKYPFSVDALVVEIKTGKQMRVKRINTEDETYSCYTNGGAIHAGDFFASEIRLF